MNTVHRHSATHLPLSCQSFLTMPNFALLSMPGALLRKVPPPPAYHLYLWPLQSGLRALLRKGPRPSQSQLILHLGITQTPFMNISSGTPFTNIWDQNSILRCERHVGISTQNSLCSNSKALKQNWDLIHCKCYECTTNVWYIQPLPLVPGKRVIEKNAYALTKYLFTSTVHKHTNMWTRTPITDTPTHTHSFLPGRVF